MGFMMVHPPPRKPLMPFYFFCLHNAWAVRLVACAPDSGLVHKLPLSKFVDVDPGRTSETPTGFIPQKDESYLLPLSKNLW